MMAGVGLDGIRKTFRDRGRSLVAVQDLTLAIADGEFLVLVGPSGCGKSTVLRVVAGLEAPDAGTIRIGGRVVNDVPPKARNVAMVFQNYALYPHMTAGENLAFALRMQDRPQAEVAERVRETAELLGLADLLHRRPGQLSGGQRQRVAVGRAIIRHPDVFLFDEPLSNLDAKLRVQMRRDLAALRRRLGTTTIYVTHDQTEAMTLGDRIAVMHEGAVRQLGTPLEVFGQPADTFVAAFIGSPPMNLLRGRMVVAGGAAFVPEGGTTALPLPGTPLPAGAGPGSMVVLGVRPEALRVTADGGDGWPAVVEEVEALGSETVVGLRLGSLVLTARLDGDAGWLARGAGVRVTPAARALHWFDGDHGRRLP
jgi:multiple sugar transport system ATP-binding protein